MTSTKKSGVGLRKLLYHYIGYALILGYSKNSQEGHLYFSGNAQVFLGTLKTLKQPPNYRYHHYDHQSSQFSVGILRWVVPSFGYKSTAVPVSVQALDW